MNWEAGDPDAVAFSAATTSPDEPETTCSDFHLDKGDRRVTVLRSRPQGHASEFGVIEATRTAAFWRSTRRPHCANHPGRRHRVYASMGNYIVLHPQPVAACWQTMRGGSPAATILGAYARPKLAGQAKIYAYDFQDNRDSGEPAISEPFTGAT